MLEIYGSSDDLVELEGMVTDEIGCYDRWAVITVGNSEGGLIVRGIYGIPRQTKEAVWSFAIEPISEDVPIPWPISIELDKNGYSPRIKIDCPPLTPVTYE